MNGRKAMRDSAFCDRFLAIGGSIPVDLDRLGAWIRKSGKINFMKIDNFLGTLSFLGEFFCSWRFYLCVLLSVPLAMLLHERFGNDSWVWFVSVPIVTAGLGGGWIWQWKHDQRQIK